ncbi:oxidoreductase, NAD-binding Rossmann fold family protein [Clostridioides difficile CD160]|nr:oxidoreductase, NAD-binding Rossmann fold family protein [Clostridioides difficile CD160]
MYNIKWAVLGPGTIASEFAQAMNELNCSVYSVASRSIERAENFANKFGIEKVYDDYDKMLKNEEIDVVYISTPHCNHYEYIMKSLENGKHVFCEKAITVNGSQLKEIVTLANEKNLIVAEAMTIYYMPLYKKLKDIIESGTLGKIKMIQVSFGSCKEYDVNNRFFSQDLAGGALLDIGTYALSFTRYFMSTQPSEILTTVKNFETGVDEQSGIILKNSNDEMAVISLTMRAKMPKRGIVAGELGFIAVENFPRASKATITYTDDGRLENIECGYTEKALKYEIEYINNCILNKVKADTIELSVDVMDLMDEIRNQWGLKYTFE